MSVFSGKMYKGARRQHKVNKTVDAYYRALNIWNGGTGMLDDKISIYGKYVQHPYYKLPKTVRDQLGALPTHNQDFPTKRLELEQLVFNHAR